MKHNNVNVIVFSLNTNLSDLILLINQCNNNHPFLCLSTLKLFDLEEDYILKAVQHEILFRCFADFLTDDEMSQCDLNAYEIEQKECLPNERRQSRYYELIKKEKNTLVLNNIRKRYKLLKKYLCARDLGIDELVWITADFIFSQGSFQIESADDINISKKGKSIFDITTFLKPIKSIIGSFKKIFKNIHIFKTKFGNFIFFGSFVRIKPYLKGVEIQKIPYNINIVLFAIIKVLFSTSPFSTINEKITDIKKIIIERHIINNKLSALLTTLHEYQDSFSSFATSIKMNLSVLQDGYLPENYSSKYLFYYSSVDNFFVWDRLSLQLFQNQKMKASICPFLHIQQLPLIEKQLYNIKTILVLTSGAGDWTALKNRSDEDQMVIAFTRVAEHFPDIQIIYRCHPIWTHPEHQGINSIARVERYFKEKGFMNIKVSEESNMLSNEFMKTHVLGFKQSSLDRDLQKADIIFGEHSFTMIEGAMKGKLFASVNLTKRRDFFLNYSKLGFHHLTSYDDIINFINELKCKPAKLLSQHNAAVCRYNSEWHR